MRGVLFFLLGKLLGRRTVPGDGAEPREPLMPGASHDTVTLVVAIPCGFFLSSTGGKSGIIVSLRPSGAPSGLFVQLCSSFAQLTKCRDGSPSGSKATQCVNHQITDRDNFFEVDAQEHTQENPGTNSHPVYRKLLTHILVGNVFRLRLSNRSFCSWLRWRRG